MEADRGSNAPPILRGSPGHVSATNRSWSPRRTRHRCEAPASMISGSRPVQGAPAVSVAAPSHEEMTTFRADFALRQRGESPLPSNDFSLGLRRPPTVGANGWANQDWLSEELRIAMWHAIVRACHRRMFRAADDRYRAGGYSVGLQPSRANRGRSVGRAAASPVRTL